MSKKEDNKLQAQLVKWSSSNSSSGNLMQIISGFGGMKS